MTLFLLILVTLTILFALGTYFCADKIGSVVSKIIKFFKEEKEND